jgi:hypothetical protein
MIRRHVPPPLPTQLTAAQRERAMVLQFVAVGLGLASGFYFYERGWTLLLNINSVVAWGAPIAWTWFLRSYTRVHASLLGVLLLLSLGRLYLIHPTSTLLFSFCASVATALFTAFLLQRRGAARALTVLLCVVLMAVQANRLFGPWLQLG